ncbi:MAG: MFS transporter [Deltaproteobacteria bacterium]|jgi:MFS family permease|nr:MFS transporter [Deltaproteobacteria bacterium]
MSATTEKPRIFSYNFIAVSLINLFVMIAYYLLFVISSPYAASRFQASASLGGLVAGVMVIGCLAGRFVCGRLICAGYKKVLFSGMAIYLSSLGLYLVAGSLPLLLGIRFLNGIGIGCIGTVTGTLIAHIVPPGQRGLGLSYFSLSTIIAMAVGPFLGIFLMRSLSFTSLFLLCLGLGLISLGIALLLRLPPLETAGEAAGGATGDAAGETCPAKVKRLGLSGFIESRVVPVSLVIVLAAVCYGCVQAFISPFAAGRGLDAEAGFFFLVYASVVFVSRPFSGRLIDAGSENLVAYPALLLTALSLGLLGLSHSPGALLLAGALLGAGFGNFQSIAQAVAIKLVPKHRFAQATSTYFIFLDLGLGLGPYLLGLLAPRFGYGGLYLFSSLIAFACIPLYYWLHGKKASRPGAPTR